MKKSLQTKTAAILLALLMILPVLASCSDPEKPSGSADTTGQSAGTDVQGGDSSDTSASKETEAERVSDDLGTHNFNKETFTIQTFENQNFNYSATAEELDGVPLNDAIYYATLAVEERFNVDIVQSLYGDGDGTPRTAILAGDSSFDLVRIRCDTAVTYWKENLLIEADKVPNVNLDKPYWDKSINDSLSVGGTKYVALSAFDLCTYDLTFSLLFNKQMITDFSFESPYALVRDGKWTMDAMNEMMIAVVSDLDGDGEYGEKDRYGYVANPKMVAPGFWIGAGAMSISKDENDVPSLSIGDEYFVGVWEKLLSICYSDNQFYGKDDGRDIAMNAQIIFSENRSLFMDMSFFFISELRQMESDFGIIPYPKYNEAQADYATRLCYYMPTIVPVTLTGERLERAGIMLEALACEYKNTVVPTYYNVALQKKYARDEDSSEMLDLIFTHRVIDMGDSTMCGTLRDGILKQMFEQNNPNIASKASSYSKMVNKTLGEMVNRD